MNAPGLRERTEKIASIPIPSLCVASLIRVSNELVMRRLGPCTFGRSKVLCSASMFAGAGGLRVAFALDVCGGGARDKRSARMAQGR